MGWEIAVRGALSTISELIWEIVNSVGQGNFSLVREKSENFKNLWPPGVATMFSIMKMFTLNVANLI